MMRSHEAEIDNASTESMRRILQMSRHEHEQKPGAVKMPGYQNSSSGANAGSNNGSNNNNSLAMDRDFSDINPRSMDMLVSMGFTVDQVVHALRMNAYDVHSAAQYLLGGA